MNSPVKKSSDMQLPATRLTRTMIFIAVAVTELAVIVWRPASWELAAFALTTVLFAFQRDLSEWQAIVDVDQQEVAAHLRAMRWPTPPRRFPFLDDDLAIRFEQPVRPARQPHAAGGQRHPVERYRLSAAEAATLPHGPAMVHGAYPAEVLTLREYRSKHPQGFGRRSAWDLPCVRRCYSAQPDARAVAW
jgi:hypothetical protein